MAVKYRHSNIYKTFFISFTCIQWLPLIERTNSYDAVYAWFEKLKTACRADVVAYIIMPNHLHIILHFNAEYFNLNSVISNGKRFIAYEIVKRLKESGDGLLLQQLNSLVSERERQRKQLHKVFKESFDAKPVITKAFLLQKINYIHHNPVRGKWMLAADYTQYVHSSASFYENGVYHHFKPMHFAELAG